MEFKKIYQEKLKETLYIGKHKSGLRVYVMPKSGYSKSYALIGTHFGSIDSRFQVENEPNQTVLPEGVAHFLEHKLFEQPDGSVVFAEYAKYGANANAFTSFNMTCYLFECTQHVSENLDILLNFVTQPYFTDENVAKEQGIIGQEIKMYEDDADWCCMINLLQALYHQHPVRQDIAGSVESIAEIDKALLYKCYRNFYNMGNMALFVIGDITTDIVAECVERNLEHYDLAPTFPKRDYGDEPTTVKKEFISQHLDVSVPVFTIGFKDDDIGYDGKELLKKNIEYSVINEIAFGKTSAIYNKLYDDGFIHGYLSFEYEGEKTYGFTMISGESEEPKRVKEIVLQGLKKLQNDGIQKEDFDRLMRAFWGRFIKQFDNITSIAHGFLTNEFNNIGLFDYLDVANCVTLESVNQRLRQSFSKENCALSVIYPTEHKLS